jgi:hypothetical protein
MSPKRILEILAAREHAQSLAALPGRPGFYDYWLSQLPSEELKLVKRYHTIFKNQAAACAAKLKFKSKGP